MEKHRVTMRSNQEIDLSEVIPQGEIDMIEVVAYQTRKGRTVAVPPARVVPFNLFGVEYERGVLVVATEDNGTEIGRLVFDDSQAVRQSVFVYTLNRHDRCIRFQASEPRVSCAAVEVIFHMTEECNMGETTYQYSTTATGGQTTNLLAYSSQQEGGDVTDSILNARVTSGENQAEAVNGQEGRRFELNAKVGDVTVLINRETGNAVVAPDGASVTIEFNTENANRRPA